MSIDQGTTSTRAVLFDQFAQVIALSQHKHGQISPRAGWLEHSPEELFTKVQLCLTDVAQQLARKHIPLAQVACCGITSQRESVVVWDRTSGVPICNTIVWADSRTADLIQLVKTEADELNVDVQELTGLPHSTYFSSSKLRWLVENDAAVAEHMASGTCMVGTVDSWLVYKLTQYNEEGPIHATDVTNASRTQLLNLKTMDWDEDLLKLYKVNRACLPKIMPSSADFGTISIKPFQGLKITGVAGDQQAALFGHCCFKPGDSKCTFGTGAFFLTNVGEVPVKPRSGLLLTVAYQISGGPVMFAHEGAIASAGSTLEWLSGLNLFKIKDVDQISEGGSNGVMVVPAFSGLFCPHWRPDARGILIGLTLGTTAGNIACAALEAIGLQVVDVIQALKQNKIDVDRLSADGGVVNSRQFCQILADLLKMPIEVRDMSEVTSLGVAMLAGLQAGVYTDLVDIKNNVMQGVEVIQPRVDQLEYCQTLKLKWQDVVKRSFNLQK